MTRPTLNATDQLICRVSETLETLFGSTRAERAYPGKATDTDQFSDREKQESARYMRVNHVGEICAQALYQSQALTARSSGVRDKMQQAANEESDHLAWCEQRIEELGGRKSLLNPLWYAGSFVIGTAAGIAGDKWNLGFVAETENQVVEHLDKHLGKLPEVDKRSREVVQQMKVDESNHAEQAKLAGAATLPAPVKSVMKLASKVMTQTAHWI